jgi:hypothetical protein
MRDVSHCVIVAGSLVLTGLFLVTPAAGAKRPPATEPDLRIIRVTLSPDSYVSGQGTLDVAIEIELPTYLDGGMLLEVSSLISSPSKRSMRFLSSRQPIALPRPGRRQRTLRLRSQGQAADDGREGTAHADELLAETGGDRNQIGDG